MRTYLENWLANDGITPSDLSTEELNRYREFFSGAGIDPDKIFPAEESFVCSICGEYVEKEHSHNAWPVNDGRCCIMCNGKYVIPSRMYGVDKVMNKCA